MKPETRSIWKGAVAGGIITAVLAAVPFLFAAGEEKASVVKRVENIEKKQEEQTAADAAQSVEINALKNKVSENYNETIKQLGEIQVDVKGLQVEMAGAVKTLDKIDAKLP